MKIDFTYKKSLGQHFLHDQEVCKRIVDLVDVSIPNWIEVGPGSGAITTYLLQLPLQQFSCIEIDKEKVDYLLANFPSLENKMQHIDFLKMPKPDLDSFCIIGNFPYNISTQIIFKVLDWKEHVPNVIGMFQKEVAVRFASKHGCKDYGITSVITQSFYDIEYLFDVFPQSFNPPPKVMSGVIRLVNNNNPYKIENFNKFKTFVKAAFSQRRKTLRNALKSILLPENLVDPIFNNRAEQISVSQFADMYHKYYA